MIYEGTQYIIDVKNGFYVSYYFYKKRVFERFYFPVAKIFSSTKPAKLLHKTIFK